MDMNDELFSQLERLSDTGLTGASLHKAIEEAERVNLKAELQIQAETERFNLKRDLKIQADKATALLLRLREQAPDVLKNVTSAEIRFPAFIDCLGKLRSSLDA